jgi:hypothetical protein
MRIGRTPRAFAHRHLVPTIIICHPERSAAGAESKDRHQATRLRLYLDYASLRSA